MKVGDLVRLRVLPDVYGIVVEIRPNAWVGKQVAVNWIEGSIGKYRLFYAVDELEIVKKN